MPNDNSIIKKAKDGIKEAAKTVEDFADKVAAPQEPVVIILDDDAPAPKPPAGRGG